MEVTIGTVFLNKSLALVAVPGSLFLEFQLLLNAKSPVTALLLSGGFIVVHPRPESFRRYSSAEGGFCASYATDD